MNSNGTGFYISLPNDSSRDIFPENNASEYTTKLPQWIELNGEWEIGLHSVAYMKWDVIDHSIGLLAYTDNGDIHEMKMKKCYTTIDDYVKYVNHSFRDLGLENKFEFTLEENGKVTIKVQANHKIILRKNQAIILGFLSFDDNDEWHKIEATTETGSYDANLYRETNIHIYCDIAQSQIVGDKTMPLLGIVPGEKTHGIYETVYAAENIHYIPLQTKSFQNIKILLRSSTDEPIPFKYGHAVVTLHLKPVNYF